MSVTLWLSAGEPDPTPAEVARRLDEMTAQLAALDDDFRAARVDAGAWGTLPIKAPRRIPEAARSQGRHEGGRPACRSTTAGPESDSDDGPRPTTSRSGSRGSTGALTTSSTRQHRLTRLILAQIEPEDLLRPVDTPEVAFLRCPSCSRHFQLRLPLGSATAPSCERGCSLEAIERTFSVQGRAARRKNTPTSHRKYTPTPQSTALPTVALPTHKLHQTTAVRVPLSVVPINRLGSDYQAATAAAVLLGGDRLEEGFPCPLPNHQGSAAVYFDEHPNARIHKLRCECPGISGRDRYLSLGDAYARHRGMPRARGLHVVVWYRRLWYDAGLLRGVRPWPLPPLAESAGQDLVRLREGFGLLFALRWLDVVREPVTMAGSFAHAWSAVPADAVPELRKTLVRAKVLKRAGTARAGGGQTSTYLPGDPG